MGVDILVGVAIRVLLDFACLTVACNLTILLLNFICFSDWLVAALVGLVIGIITLGVEFVPLLGGCFFVLL